MQRRTRARVLVVDDKLEMGETIADGLQDHGYDAVAEGSSRTALERLASEQIDVLVTDLRMPAVDGLALLDASRRANPARPVIVMTAFGAIDSAIESIRRGAYHYLTKPFQLEELVIFLGRALEERQVRQEAAALRETLRERFSRTHLVGTSRAMAGLLAMIERLADSDTPVLVSGETGTGKGLVARALHAESRRASRPFVAVNCAALPEPLLESELFGHVKGAFTGAAGDRSGLFAEADGGTIFLDEIGEMPLALQAKLLHVLESGAVRPVGSTRERAVDFRVVAATNRDLRERVAAGTFRADLLYRLDVVPIELPPLRQRRDDLPPLIEHFLRKAREKHPSSPVERLAPDALAALLSYWWPGNVRELAHVLERVVLLGRGPQAECSDLPASLLGGGGQGPMQFSGDVMPIRELQRRYAAWALAECGGHRGRTAERLGVDGKTLAKWLAEEAEMAQSQVRRPA